MNLKIINSLIIVACLSAALSACNNTRTLLCRQWKTVSLVNTKLEREVQDMKTYIDTLGKQDPSLRNEINLDSTRFLLEQELHNSLKEHKLAEDNTIIEFKPNGICYTTTLDGTDSAHYELDNQLIKIDEAALKGYGETMTFEIMRLTKNVLELRVIDYGDTSYITMNPLLEISK